MPPLDLDAPEWVPIHGVTLDRYVELAVLITGCDDDERERRLQREGVGQGTWPAIDAGWQSRIIRSAAVAARHRALAGS